ncbi:HdeD family acid-resistance protein [uncultured Prevotella sp.]|uniref:HdeD family acid-resistance protein n=1 Tax=uncultured Prevotella sp. TaxID=159272 RepID=UPI00260991F9|nr:DUF308 domain-containing protein [uncultured Prevotella sp.]
MKILQSSVFRAICAIAVGAMLIKNPDSTVKGITIAIGILFLVSGVISCVAYFNARLHSAENEVYDADGKLLVGGRPMFPIVGLGSVILGFVLALMPGAFVTSLMYVLGGIILLGALNQFMVLIQARKFATLPLWFWVCPTLVLLTGLFVMIKPMESASLPLLIIGWCLLFYGVTECINAFKIHQYRKKMIQS